MHWGGFRKFYSKDNKKPEFSDGTVFNHKVIDKIIVITTKRRAAVARLWDTADDIIELPEHEVEAIQRYSQYPFAHLKNILLPFRTEDDYFYRLHGISTWSVSWALQIPPYEEQKIPCKYSEWTIEQGREMINQYGVRKNDAVVLIPSAYTLPNFPVTFWEKLVKKLVEKGKQVFVNCSMESDQEIAACGATMIDFPMDVFLYFCEYAGKVISNQSGLGDLIVSSGREISLDMLLYDEVGNNKVREYIHMRLGDGVKKKQHDENYCYYLIDDVDIAGDKIYEEFL